MQSNDLSYRVRRMRWTGTVEFVMREQPLVAFKHNERVLTFIHSSASPPQMALTYYHSWNAGMVKKNNKHWAGLG